MRNAGTIFVAVLTLFVAVGCSGGGNGFGNVGTTSTASTNNGNGGPVAAVVPPTAYQGHWTGQWRNQTFNTTGGLTLDITVNAAASTVAVTETFTGNVLGAGTPPTETINGSYNNSGLSLTGQTIAFGAVNFTVSPTGSISGTATNPNANVSRVTVTGTSDGATMTLNYVVQFTPAAGGGTAQGVISLTKQAAAA